MVMQGARASAAMVLTMSYQDIPASVPIGPDGMIYGANMGPNWGRQDPSGPHVGPMNHAICGSHICISWFYQDAECATNMGQGRWDIINRGWNITMFALEIEFHQTVTDDTGNLRWSEMSTVTLPQSGL